MAIESPLNKKATDDINWALEKGGIEKLPPDPNIKATEQMVAKSMNRRELDYRYDREQMHLMKPPSLGEMLGCLAIPLGAIAASAIVLRKLYKLKNK